MTAKKTLLLFCVAGGAACLAVVFFRQRGGDAAPQRAVSAIAREAGRGADDIASRFSARMSVWETSRYPESDQLEQELKALVNDDNAAVILQALPARFQSTYLANEMLARWAARDRLAALRWLAAQTEQTHAQVVTVVSGWGGDQTATLTSYVEQLPAGVWKEQLSTALVQDALRQQDPELAFSMAATLSSGDAQVRLLRDAAMKWSTWDPRSVLAEVEGLPDAALQEKLIPYVAIGYAHFAPREAANWITRSLAPGDLLTLGLDGIVRTWAGQHDAAAAAAWVEQMPRGPLQDRVIETLVATWNDRNAAAAKAWIDRLPENDGLRSRAYASLSRPD